MVHEDNNRFYRIRFTVVLVEFSHTVCLQSTVVFTGNDYSLNLDDPQRRFIIRV